MDKHWLFDGKTKRVAEPWICKECSKEFLRRIVVPQGKRKQEFCSRKCRFAKTDRLVLTCSTCDVQFMRAKSKVKHKNYCSRQCKNIAETKARKVCLNCSRDVGSRTGRKYCSYPCQWDFLYKEYIKRWLAGEEDGVKGDQTSIRIKKFLLEEIGHKCSQCGWDKINPFSGKKPLELNHKDGNSYNNRLDNLEILCPSCHSLTSNYGILNKGNGRKIRREKRRARSSAGE